MTALADQLQAHLEAWLANTRYGSERARAAAMLDPERRGPLADPEFVTGLVANLDEHGAWPAIKPPAQPAVPAAAHHQLRLVKHDRTAPEFVDDL